MKDFHDELQEIVVPRGVADDRLNRELTNYVTQVYVRGLKAGVKLGQGDIGDGFTDEIVKTVEKEKRALSEELYG